MRNRSATLPVSRMFDTESTSLLPGRSGRTSVVASTTFTDPGGSPRGLTSAFPPASTVPSARNGERAMNVRKCSSMTGRIFWATRSPGAPMIASTSLRESASGSPPLDSIRARFPVQFASAPTMLPKAPRRSPMGRRAAWALRVRRTGPTRRPARLGTAVSRTGESGDVRDEHQLRLPDDARGLHGVFQVL